MTVTVYAMPSSNPLRSTCRDLDAKGVAYQLHDISQDAALREHLVNRGYIHTPVVIITDEDEWSGYRPDKIDELKTFIDS